MADYWDARQDRLSATDRLPFAVAEQVSPTGSFLYVPGQLLADSAVALSLDLGNRPGFAPVDADQDWLDGTQLSLWNYTGPVAVPRLCAELRAESGSSRVAPHYVLTGEGKSTVPRGGPAGPPAPHAAAVLPDDWGSGLPVVAVLDTGVALETRTGGQVNGSDAVVWDHAVDRDELRAVQPDGSLAPGLASQAGHGTFIASVIQRMTGGGSRIVVIGVLDADGFGTEQRVVDGLKRLRTQMRRPPAVVNLSLGGFTDDGGWLDDAERTTLFPLSHRDQMPLGLAAELAAWNVDPWSDTAFVCAAGNDGEDRPFWPAAAARPDDPGARPAIVSVASLTAAGDASDFSNHGTWVAVGTCGEDILGDYPAGEMDGLNGAVLAFAGGGATWSGTSFAAPVLAAELVRRCRDDHRSGAAAWQDLAQALVAKPSPAPGFGRLYDPVAERGVDPRL
jgi:hypothetical protein